MAFFTPICTPRVFYKPICITICSITLTITNYCYRMIDLSLIGIRTILITILWHKYSFLIEIHAMLVWVICSTYRLLAQYFSKSWIIYICLLMRTVIIKLESIWIFWFLALTSIWKIRLRIRVPFNYSFFLSPCVCISHPTTITSKVCIVTFKKVLNREWRGFYIVSNWI